MNPTELGSDDCDWVQMIQDRDQLWALVCMCSIRDGILLDQLTYHQLHRKDAIYGVNDM